MDLFHRIRHRSGEECSRFPVFLFTVEKKQLDHGVLLQVLFAQRDKGTEKPVLRLLVRSDSEEAGIGNIYIDGMSI